MKIVCITGASGQDGLNMISYLLEKTNYTIVGTSYNDKKLKHINKDRFIYEKLDITDEVCIRHVFVKYKPDYFINFAAKSSVVDSWKHPKLTFQTNTMAIINILEIIRNVKPSCRFYSAGSSEEFGEIETTPQTLNHPLRPRSPYGASKCAARHVVKVYRDCYNLFAIHCILFNHESIHRDKQFVTRKITSNLAQIKYKIEKQERFDCFELGNIDARRDWSYSNDFMEAIWIMLNQDKPDEYILSSNKDYSIKEFINMCCKSLGLNNTWVLDEDPLNTKMYINNKLAITINEKYYRPAEIHVMRGDSRETYKKLNWTPKTSIQEMINIMCNYDYKLLSNKDVN